MAPLQGDGHQSFDDDRVTPSSRGGALASSASRVARTSRHRGGDVPRHGVAAAPAPPADAAAQQLAERFAPIVMLKQQAEACDPDGEPYATEGSSRSCSTTRRSPCARSAAAIRRSCAARRAGSVRDSTGVLPRLPRQLAVPGCLYEQDFWRYAGDLPAAVYAHVVQSPTNQICSPSSTGSTGTTTTGTTSTRATGRESSSGSRPRRSPRRFKRNRWRPDTHNTGEASDRTGTRQARTRG